MKQQRVSVIYLILSFFYLLAISYFRRRVILDYPGLKVGYFLVYLGYLSLLFCWIMSIYLRVTQRHIRRSLVLEAATIFCGITVRFVQDAFLQNDIAALRFSGILVCSSLWPLVLSALYTSFGLGVGDGYSPTVNKSVLASLGCIPISILITDDYHHFVFKVIPGEEAPNILFHPGVGFYLLTGLGIMVIILRVIVIFKRNTMIISSRKGMMIVPFIHIILLLVFLFPYALSSFYVTRELVELFAGIYYLEAISWELYILVGLVPVNTSYTEAFRNSTIAMQILDMQGNVLESSEHAQMIQPELFHDLWEHGKLLAGSKEINLYRKDGFYIVWEKEVHLLQSAILKLKESEAQLEEKGLILQEEFRRKNEETSIAAKNQIYSQLSDETMDQLIMIRKLIDHCRVQKDHQEYYQRILFLGTYIKRRCNLRLLQLEFNEISLQDLSLACKDISKSLKRIGINMQLTLGHNISMEELLPADYVIQIFDQIEKVIEQEDFKLDSLQSR